MDNAARSCFASFRGKNRQRRGEFDALTITPRWMQNGCTQQVSYTKNCVNVSRRRIGKRCAACSVICAEIAILAGVLFSIVVKRGFGIIRKMMRPAVFGVFRERLGGARLGELWKAIEGFLFFAAEASVSTMCRPGSGRHDTAERSSFEDFGARFVYQIPKR